MSATTLQLIIPIAGVVAVLFAIYLARDVLSRDKGPQAMQDVGVVAGSATQLGTLLIPEPNALVLGAAALLALRVVVRRRSAC